MKAWNFAENQRFFVGMLFLAYLFLTEVFYLVVLYYLIKNLVLPIGKDLLKNIRRAIYTT
jgi:hypothetical protein